MNDWETPLWAMLQQVDVSKEPGEQPQTLRQFDDLTPAQLDEMVAINKSEEAAIVIQYLPAEQFAGRLAELLSGVMDYNWPGAWRTAQALSAIGAPLLPAIRQVFRTDRHDHIWLANIISGIIRPWPDALARELQPELIEIAGYADADGAASHALRVLQRLLPPAEFEPLYQRTRQHYAAHDPELGAELDKALSRW